MKNFDSHKQKPTIPPPIALITGASRGIGAGIARALAKEGYDLVLCCEKNRALLETLAKGLREDFGADVLTCVGDVGDPAFAPNCYEKTTAHFGRTTMPDDPSLEADAKIFTRADGSPPLFSGIDVLVNNAGISHIGLLTDMTSDEWNRVLSVNLSSCFYFARAFAPDMIRRKSGHILSISSIWGSRGASCEVAYSASKGGVEAFTKALAKELAPSHVAVNAISCGVIDTDMNRGFSEEEIRGLIEEIPCDRLGTAEDVSRCVVGLLRMSYVTGQVLGVDGGF